MTPEDDPPVSDANPIIYTEVERSSAKGYDAASPADVQKMRVSKELRERGVREFYQHVFSTEIGRLAMWDILAAAHTFETKFATAGGLPQPEATWFELGKQMLGHDLYLTWMKYDPEGVALMLRENEARLRTDEPLKPKRTRARKSPPSAP